MNISLEKSDAVTAKLTVKMEKADYENEVEKSLKKIRQKANMPGFRPGNVPMGLVKKMYGTEVKAEEVNKKLSESVIYPEIWRWRFPWCRAVCLKGLYAHNCR